MTMNRLGQLLATEDEWRGTVRALGGLLLGSGLLLVFLRRSLLTDPWGDVALLLVLLVAFALLYGTGLLAVRSTAERASWQDAFLIFGTLVVPLVLLQFVRAIDGDAGAPLNIAWVFAVTAVAAAAITALAELRYGLFIASLAAIVSWLGLWDAILADGIFEEIGTLRVLLVAIGVGLMALGAGARLFGGVDGPERANEILTGGAVAVVGAGAVSIAAFIGRLLLGPIAIAQPTAFWDAYLLVASLGVLGLAGALRVRGLGYVGAIGLAVFTVVVGLDLDEARPEGSLVGWPLIVLVVGAAAFVASLIRLVELPVEEEVSGGEAPDADAASGAEPGGGQD